MEGQYGGRAQALCGGGECQAIGVCVERAAQRHGPSDQIGGHNGRNSWWAIARWISLPTPVWA